MREHQILFDGVRANEVANGRHRIQRNFGRNAVDISVLLDYFASQRLNSGDRLCIRLGNGDEDLLGPTCRL